MSPAKAIPRTSDILTELAGAFSDDRVTVKMLLAKLEHRAIGFLLLVLALPNALPNIPGISTLFGILMIGPGIQMLIGAKKLWVPRPVCGLSLKRAHFSKAMLGSAKIVRQVERFVRPRLQIFISPPFTMALGALVLLSAFVLILPIPLGNVGFGVAVSAIAIALLQKDGALALASVALFIGALALARVGLGAAVSLLSNAWNWVF